MQTETKRMRLNGNKSELCTFERGRSPLVTSTVAVVALDCLIWAAPKARGVITAHPDKAITHGKVVLAKVTTLNLQRHNK